MAVVTTKNNVILNDAQEWLSVKFNHNVTLILASLDLSHSIVKGVAEVLKAGNQLDVRHDETGFRS